MPSITPTLEFDVDEAGRGSVLLDGHALNTRAVEIITRIGEPTVVRLELVNIRITETPPAIVDAKS